MVGTPKNQQQWKKNKYFMLAKVPCCNVRGFYDKPNINVTDFDSLKLLTFAGMYIKKSDFYLEI